MNCPSRNDDDLENPGWNQSPPRFAADLTTCEDMNGIANSRELGDADRFRSGSQNLRHLELEDNNFEEMDKALLVAGRGVKGSLTGDSSPEGTIEYRVLTIAQDLAPEQPHA
jgi:zinc transporter 1/2/3